MSADEGFISLIETARIAEELKRLFLGALVAAHDLDDVARGADENQNRVSLAICARLLAGLAFGAEDLFPRTVPPLDFEPASIAGLEPGSDLAGRAAFMLDRVVAPAESLALSIAPRARAYRDQNLLHFLDVSSRVLRECRELLDPITKI